MGAGRDVLSRVLSGARLTVLSTFTVIFVVLVIGCTIGIFSAFAGGWIDNIDENCRYMAGISSTYLSSGLAAAWERA